LALFKRSDLIKEANDNRLSKSMVESNFIKLAGIKKSYDIFLSHSFLDAIEVETLKSKIETLGYSVYVDWLEDSFDRENVTQETAEIIKRRMENCKCLLYATSKNSKASKWMPWELGFFDGRKEKVAILPVIDDINGQTQFKGQEYLTLYPYVDIATIEGSSEFQLWINTSDGGNKVLKSWI
jgi:hypothetical protein